MRNQLIILSVLSCALNFTTRAQTSVVVCGHVLDDAVNPIADCNVSAKGTPYVGITNKKGFFVFNHTFIKGARIRVAIDDVKFSAFEKEYTVAANNSTKDTMFVELMLESNVLISVDVFAHAIEVYASKQLNVHDFEFVQDKILLLTYEKRLGHNMKLVLVDNEGEELSTHLVNNAITKIEKDYEGNIHILSDESAYLVTLYEKQIYILAEKKEEYIKYIQPILTKANNQLYFSNYTWHYPAFNYYAYNTVDSSYKNLKYIEDKFLLELYRAEYKYVDTRLKLEAYRMQLRTGIDKEIWAAVWSGFPNSLYYKQLYAPMFARNDSVLVFDHYSNHIFYYNSENQLLDSASINYHLGKEGNNWKKRMLMDEVTKKIYNVFAHNGNYVLVELGANGKAITTTALEYKYPEQIKVNNGFVYYNYRPFESSQNKYLYKQLLR